MKEVVSLLEGGGLFMNLSKCTSLTWPKKARTWRAFFGSGNDLFFTFF